MFFFFSSRRRHTRCSRDWSSDVCSSDLPDPVAVPPREPPAARGDHEADDKRHRIVEGAGDLAEPAPHDRILPEHLTRHVTEQATPEPDEPRGKVHEVGEKTGAPNDEGERERGA